MNKLKSLLNGVLIFSGVVVGLMAVGLVGAYMSVRAKELPLSSAREFIQLEPGDEVVHAYTGFRWLDSQRYFVLKADPASFDARIKKITEEHPKIPGASISWEVGVHERPGKDLWYRTESTPSWWDVDSLATGIAVDVSVVGHNNSGFLSIFSKDRGLIYIINR